MRLIYLNITSYAGRAFELFPKVYVKYPLEGRY